MKLKILSHEVKLMDTDLEPHQRVNIKELLYEKSSHFFSEHRHIKKTVDGAELQNPKAGLISLFLPYVLEHIGDGIMRLNNRHYKPFGIGYSHGFIEDSDKRWQLYRYKEEPRPLEIKYLVNCYPKDWRETSSRIERFHKQNGYVAFYGDACSPWQSEAKFKFYMRRLSVFCDLIDDGIIERVN